MDSSQFNAYVIVIGLSFGSGGLVALFGPRQYKFTGISLLMAFVGSVTTFLLALECWVQPMTEGVLLLNLPALVHNLPALALEFYIDRLAAFFLLLTGAFSAGVACYSFGWLRAAVERHRVAGAYNLFVLSTALTIIANNTYFLFFFLECMTLTFAFLVLYRHNKYLEAGGATHQELAAAKTAFKSYLIFSHVGVMLLLAALLVLPAFGSPLENAFDFDALRQGVRLPHPANSLVFLLALAGLGIKAGIVPAHVWVPVVHPYSPTTTHAFSLGVTIKVAIYLMVRIFFQFLRPVEWWWGLAILLLAGLTALVGVFYALMGQDLKTALASHSVENIGIILAGLGLALIFKTDEFSTNPALVGFEGLAGLALVASLYHVLNHATFKGLLYLCTGAIENRTGTVEFNKLGGLMKRYPWTALAFLTGSVAIAGFPPFNGFASEWLTLQALFGGMNLFQTPHKLPYLVGLTLALLLLGAAFGLTALAFVKIAGETLLGAPRSAWVATHSRSGDVPWSMRGVLVILALLCLLFGLFPALVAGQLGRVAHELHLSTGNLAGDPFNLWLQVPVSLSDPAATQPQAYQTGLSVWFMAAAGLIVLLPAALAFVRRRRRQLVSRPVWTCGAHYEPEAMQFTGGALAALVWQPFARQAGPEDPAVSHRQKPDYLPRRLYLSGTRFVHEYFRQGYNLAAGWLVRFSAGLGNWFQSGDIRRYLAYIFIIFFVVLLLAFSIAR